MRKSIIPVILAVAAAMVIFASCKSSEGGPTKTPEELIAAGWQYYLSHDYTNAADQFNQALAQNNHLVDAYNGLGWSRAKLGQIATAVTNFATGFGMDTSNLDIRAGLAFAYNAQKSYAQSISSALAVLAVNMNWTFSHDNTVNASQLQLVLAEDYFATADYASSLARVQVLDPVFTANVTTIQGQTELAQEIESLRVTFG